MFHFSILQLIVLFQFLILNAVNPIAQYSSGITSLRGSEWRSSSTPYCYFFRGIFPKFFLIVESYYPGQIIMLQLFLHFLYSSQNSSRSTHAARVYCYPIICFTITCTVFQVADVAFSDIRGNSVGVSSPKQLSSSSSYSLDFFSLGEPTGSNATADVALRVTRN